MKEIKCIEGRIYCGVIVYYYHDHGRNVAQTIDDDKYYGVMWCGVASLHKD